MLLLKYMFPSMPHVAAASTPQHLQLQSLVGCIFPRRLLLHTPLDQPSGAAAASPFSGAGGSQPLPGFSLPGGSFDANVVMVLAVVLILVTCALALNSIVRCALKCSGDRLSFAFTDGEAANAGELRAVELPEVGYSSSMVLAGAGSECVICLSEFTAGERLRVIPGCNHGFHVKCVDRWLRSHSSCPTCRRCLICSTPEKISGHSAREVQQAAPVQMIITPQQREGVVIDYWAGC